MDKPAILSIAKALLINNRREVLVLTIGDHKTKPYMSYQPDLPGGQVDPGETVHEGVVREISEETGITVNPPRLVPIYSHTKFVKDEQRSITKHLFIAELDDNPEVTLSWEHVDYRWVPIDELRSKDFRSFYAAAIEYCLTNGMLSINNPSQG